MIHIEGEDDGRQAKETELVRTESGTISVPDHMLTVGQLELALVSRFPRSDAQDWDVMGLTVGDPAALVRGVMVALDPTAEAIDACVRAGANVLVTHHPAFLSAPTKFSPNAADCSASGSTVYRAASEGVALINLHTALDVSLEAQHVLPGMLSLDFQRVLQPYPSGTKKGFGQLCTVRAQDAPFTLGRLAARCTSVFGRMPRVWGDMQTPVRRVVCANGSASSLVDDCISAHVDCLVCGEVKYHSALAAKLAGLSIIELGHDTSELPYTALLAQAVSLAGVDERAVSILDQSGNWDYPESTRL